MNRLTRRLCALLVGFALAALALTLWAVVASSPAWQSLSEGLVTHLRSRPGGWRLMRGGLHYLVLPGLGLLGLVVAGLVWRRDRPALPAFVTGAVLTSLAVQGTKQVQLPGAPELNPLSGHLGVAAGLALPLLVLPVLPLLLRVLGSLALLVGTGGGVLLAGWHTLPQVAAPLGIGAACVVLAMAVAPGRERPTMSALLPSSIAGCGVIGLTAIAYAVTHLDVPAAAPVPFGTAATLAFAALTSAALLAIGLVLLAWVILAQSRPQQVRGRANAARVSART